MVRSFIVLLGLFMITSLDAQPGNHWDKPRSRAMKQESATIKYMVTSARPVRLKGADAKNQVRTGRLEGRTMEVVRSGRMRLKGPAAKNYQPRIRKSSPNIFRHSSRNE